MDRDNAACEERLQLLAEEYAELVRLSEEPSLEAEERRIVAAQRSLTHDQIIALFEQIGIPFVDRDDVRRQALALARGHQ